MSVITWLENNMLECFYVKHFNHECPGCGFQRAIIELLKGNIVESFYFYPALLPILIMFVVLVLHIIFKFKNGANWLKYMFIFNNIIVLISFFLK